MIWVVFHARQYLFGMLVYRFRPSVIDNRYMAVLVREPNAVSTGDGPCVSHKGSVDRSLRRKSAGDLAQLDGHDALVARYLAR